MPRTARSTPAGFCYHAFNRGNARRQVFHHEGDYAAFGGLLREAVAGTSARLLGFCLMPNHFHLALWPQRNDDLSSLMHWLLTTHARRYQKQYRSTGHVWQGRFKAFPIQEDDQLLAVLRYLERNPLRAGRVERAEDWRWSSLRWHLEAPLMAFLHAGPVARPNEWAKHLNTPQSDAHLAALRRCAQHGAPFGNDDWVKPTADKLGLGFTLRRPGRPKKQQAEPGARPVEASLF